MKYRHTRCRGSKRGELELVQDLTDLGFIRKTGATTQKHWGEDHIREGERRRGWQENPYQSVHKTYEGAFATEWGEEQKVIRPQRRRKTAKLKTR